MIEVGEFLSATFTPDGVIAEVCPRFAGLFGYTPDELAGRHHRLIVPPETADHPSYAEMWQTLARGTSLSGTFERVARDGTRRWMAAAYTPERGASGVVRVRKRALDCSTLINARDRQARDEALVLTVRAVCDLVLNTMNGLRFGYDEAADHAGLSASEREVFETSFDSLESGVRRLAGIRTFAAGTRGGTLQLDYWTPRARRPSEPG
jgi:PAS domain S-box-containing protein